MINPEIEKIAQLTDTAIQETADLFEENIKEWNNHYILTQFFLSKSVTSYYAVWNLCKSGYGQDAFVITRTIFENLVNLSFLNKEPTIRVPLFIEFDHIKAYKRLQDYEKLFPEKPKEDSIRQHIISQYENFKSNYPNKNSWTRESLLDMAKSCDLESYYYMVYRLGSIFTHGASDSVQDYIGQEKNLFSIRFGKPSREKTNLALFTACSLVMIIIQKACGVYSLKPPDCCINVIKHLDEIGEDVVF